jgi:predicted transcriptional regulator
MSPEVDSGDVSLSDLQLSVMRVLWDRGEACTADVVEALRKGPQQASGAP